MALETQGWRLGNGTWAVVDAAAGRPPKLKGVGAKVQAPKCTCPLTYTSTSAPHVVLTTWTATASEFQGLTAAVAMSQLQVFPSASI